MQYCKAFVTKEDKEKIYKGYVTDALHAISENTAVSASLFTKGEAGKSLKNRWLELDSLEIKEEKRTPKEIIDHVFKKLASV